MSVLRPETVAVLREVRPAEPAFSNAILAELWDAANTLGPFQLHRRTDGAYAIFDDRRPWNDRVCEVVTGERAAKDRLRALYAAYLASGG